MQRLLLKEMQEVLWSSFCLVSEIVFQQLQKTNKKIQREENKKPMMSEINQYFCTCGLIDNVSVGGRKVI